MTQTVIIWLPSLSDDLTRYTFKIIANDDFTYQFGDIYPDGNIDYWYEGRKFRWSGDEFLCIDEDGTKFAADLRPNPES